MYGGDERGQHHRRRASFDGGGGRDGGPDWRPSFDDGGGPDWRDRDRDRDRDWDNYRGRDRDARDRYDDYDCDNRRRRRESFDGGRGGRGPPRDRDRDREPRRRRLHAPSAGAILMGLPPDATEEAVGAAVMSAGAVSFRYLRAKSIAFVDFDSTDSASRFVYGFSGSSGQDPSGPQLYVGSCPVSIDFVNNEGGGGSGGGGGAIGGGDWWCANCRKSNYASRGVCFSCSAPRSAGPPGPASGPDPLTEDLTSQHPTALLIVRGLPSTTNYRSVKATLSKFSAPGTVTVEPDWRAGPGFGLAYAMYGSADEVSAALTAAAAGFGEAGLSIDGYPVSLWYARDPATLRWRKKPAGLTHPSEAQSAFGATASALQHAHLPSGGAHLLTGSGGGKRGKQIVINGRPFPPRFERSGDSYELDFKTGFFFHKPTGFLYDAASKTYLHQASSTYYRLENQRYTEWHPPVPPGDPPVVAPAPAPSTPTAMPSSVVPGPSPSSKKPSLKTRAAAADIGKWQSKQSDLAGSGGGGGFAGSLPQSEGVGSAAAAAPPAATAATATAATAAAGTATAVPSAKRAPPTTKKKAAFACYLCRRGFPSAAALEKHNLKSEMHKKKLEEKQNEGYRDRAAERRQMHGTSDKPVSSVGKKRPRKAPKSGGGGGGGGGAGAGAAADLNKPIDDSNKGSQLLKKLGYRGGGLGKDETGIAAPVGIAGQQGRQGLGAGFGSDAGVLPTDSYKVAALKKARARYQDGLG